MRYVPARHRGLQARPSTPPASAPRTSPSVVHRRHPRPRRPPGRRQGRHRHRRGGRQPGHSPSATPVRPSRCCSWPRRSRPRSPARSSPWWCCPTAATCSCSGPPTPSAAWQPRRTVAQQIEAGNAGLPYLKFLAWNDMVTVQPPNRPEPARASSSAAARNEDWKYGFVGSRDRDTGAMHLPPARVSFVGGHVDDMEPQPDGRRRGHRRHLHRRSPGLLAEPAHRVRGGRLRRRRPAARSSSPTSRPTTSPSAVGSR